MPTDKSDLETLITVILQCIQFTIKTNPHKSPKRLEHSSGGVDGDVPKGDLLKKDHALS